MDSGYCLRGKASITDSCDARELAAWIVGEGHITVRIWKRSPRTEVGLRVGVTNTDSGVLDRVRTLAGCGTIYWQSRTREGKKRLGWWECTGYPAQEIVRAIQPYLAGKQRQAEIALLMPVRKHGGRPADGMWIRIAKGVAYSEMKKLHSRRKGGTL